jgi:hypothetical protein
MLRGMAPPCTTRTTKEISSVSANRITAPTNELSRAVYGQADEGGDADNGEWRHLDGGRMAHQPTEAR